MPNGYLGSSSYKAWSPTAGREIECAPGRKTSLYQVRMVKQCRGKTRLGLSCTQDGGVGGYCRWHKEQAR